MKKTNLLVSILTVVAILNMTQCKKTYLNNKTPVANAGNDTVVGSRNGIAELNGLASFDPNGLITSFEWELISGPGTYTIDDVHSAKSIVSNLVIGLYNFRLTVTDKYGNISYDDKLINVVRTVKARIMEWGTDMPLSNAEINLKIQNPSSFNNELTLVDTTIITNSNGEFSFDANLFKNMRVGKEHYWEYDGNERNPLLSQQFPQKTPITPDENGMISCDSFTVKLLPEVFITVHMKDSSGNYNYDPELVCLGIIRLDSATSYTPSYGNKIGILKHIDTTFQFHVYGNIENYFYAGEPWAISSSQIFFEKNVFLSKGDKFTLNIVY